MLKNWSKDSVKGYAECHGADRREVIWMNYEPPKDNQLSLFERT